MLLSGFAMVRSHSRPREPTLGPYKGLEGGCLATFSNLFPSPSSLGRVTEGMSSGLLVTVLNPDSGTLR